MVRAKTRDRVLQAIAELKYYPNLNASALASSRSRSIGVFVPNLENPFFYDIYAAISRIAASRGFDTLLETSFFRADRLREGLQRMVEAKAIGVVVVDGAAPDSFGSEIAKYGIRVAVPADVEYVLGIERLLQYLSSLGHRRVGIVEHRAPVLDTRTAALRGAFQRFPQLQFRTSNATDTLDGGLNASRDLLTGDFAPTALICTHDIMAIGALREAREQGYCVPDDLSVIGLDNIVLASFCVPPLTTVDVSRERIATALCQSLFGETPSVAVDCALIVRDSTTAARVQAPRKTVSPLK